MTLEELISSAKLLLTPDDVAPILGSDPHTIRNSAREQPDLVGFAFTMIGNRMKIPRVAFLKWLGLEEKEIRK